VGDKRIIESMMRGTFGETDVVQYIHNISNNPNIHINSNIHQRGVRGVTEIRT